MKEVHRISSLSTKNPYRFSSCFTRNPAIQVIPTGFPAAIQEIPAFEEYEPVVLEVEREVSEHCS